MTYSDKKIRWKAYPSNKAHIAKKFLSLWNRDVSLVLPEKIKKKKKKEDFHDDKSGETFFSSYFLNSHSEHIEFVEIKTFQLKMIKYIFYHPILKIIIEFYTYVIQSFFFRYFNI